MKIEEVLKKLENVNDKMAEQIVAKLPDDLKDKTSILNFITK